jgi:DNA-binding transcriptional MocR family regulator
MSSRSWTPTLSGGGRSIAVRLADAIAADVASGKLSAGDRLPTQRALAQQIGVTVGTVNRGYALAERAGLISAEVGRGTFVTAIRGAGFHDASVSRRITGAIELGLNYPGGDDAEEALQESLGRLARRGGLSGMLGLSPYAGRPHHRAAGARWLGELGIHVNGEEVLVSTSAQHGLAATLSALTAPGDVVLTESLTSPGMKAVAAAHHLRLVGVDCDDDGIVPDALAIACRSNSAKVLYTMPTLHTPTTITMPASRREAIAGVLARERLIAVEDDAWGFLAQGTITPLRSLRPDAVVYLTSVSKSLAPGLRVGYVVAPASLQRAVTTFIGATTWPAPFLAEIVSQWIDDGTARAIAVRRLQTATERQRLAESLLGPGVRRSSLPAYHCWLHLPEPWRVEDFVADAAARGVSLAPTDTFVPGRAATPHAVRVCTGTEADVNRVERGLRVLAELLSPRSVGSAEHRPPIG